MNTKPLILTLIFALVTACAPASPSAPPTETLTPGPTPWPSPTVTPTPVPGVLYVDPGQSLGTISPYVYGTNYGPMQAVPLDMLPTAFGTGFTVLRWPGGAVGDTLNVQGFQIDTYIAFAKQMGAMPTISVRLHGGTPEQAAHLVDYTNINKKYGVVYWSIGNEPSLYEQQFHESYDTVRFNREWRAIAEAMKKVDPTIKLIGPEIHQWGSSLQTTLKDSAGRDWMTEFLKANGDLVDVVSVHRYPLAVSGGRLPTLSELRDNTKQWDAEIAYLRSLVREVTGRDLPIAYTEVNSNPTNATNGDATPDSFYNAIWYADVLGRLISQRVFIVNQWVISQRDGGLGLIHGSDVRPTLYVFHMYKQFGSELVYAASGVDGVTAYAAKRPDGTLTLMVVNLSDSAQQVPLQVQGASPAAADVWRLDATHQAEDLGQQPITAGMLDLPAQSVSLYAFGK